MKRESVLKILRAGVIAAFSAAAVMSCNKNEELPPPTPVNPDGLKIYIAGTAANGIPDEYREVKQKGEKYAYQGILNSGGLSFRTTEKGEEGLLYITGVDTGVSTSGNAREVERGFYEFEIDPENGTFKMKNATVFGSDNIYLSGGDAFFPRAPKWDAHVMPPMKQSADNPFLYTYCHPLGVADAGTSTVRFFMQRNHGAAQTIRDTDGKALFFADSQAVIDAGKGDSPWTINSAADYMISFNIMTREVTVTPATFYPNNVTEMYAIGNAFGNGFNSPATLDAYLTEPVWTEGPEGEPVAMESVGAVRMTQSAADPYEFSITADLNHRQGGFWFLFQRDHSVPALLKENEGTGKYFMPASKDDASDMDAANQWSVSQSGNYTITVNVRTNAVTVTPNSLVDPTGEDVVPEGYELYLAGTATTGIPEADLKLVDAGDKMFTYDHPLNNGELYLVARKAGSDDINFYFTEDGTKITEEGSKTKSVDKGIYSLQVDAEQGAFTSVGSFTLGDALWMHAGHINYPRYGDFSSHIMPSVPVSEDNPFVYVTTNRFYPQSQPDQGFSFFTVRNNTTSPRFFDGGNGKISIDTGEQWKVNSTQELRITLDLYNMTYKVEEITLYPDNVEGVYIVGNTFGNNNGAGFATGQAVDMFLMGRNMNLPDYGAVVMTKDASNPQKYSITADLKADQGTFWFLLRRQGSLPCILKDDNGDAYYYPGPADPMADNTDALDAKHWSVAEDGNYTITLDMGTGKVDITKN